ncbi:hypothetical protein CLV63_103356 [Murinocardiopsis flavida]|uniref:Metalloprotease n=1 Tax=Murinocardiopsis flavida TaxID=645275 RepID=A0A2P8DQY9_9ACTN|nr:neutral zinc metallopeptidase [Murinocardiopsis flavida]PSK99631.1 hypothetical protein CLV63_103356 [Murinocardiopsis flavida]
MPERGHGAVRTYGRRGGRRLPPYAQKPRQRLGLGVMSVLVVGLGALGFAAFLGVAALFDGDRAHASGADPLTLRPPQAAGTPDEGTGEGGPDALGQSPLYSAGELAEAECPAPKLDAEDSASMERYLHRMTDCLDTAWQTEFEQRDLAYSAPTRVYWTRSGNSPCGEYPANGSAAFYCPSNKGLYLGVEDIVASSDGVEHPEAYTFLLGHEYGHHVQSEAGILDGFRKARGDAADGEGRDNLTRRSELQANCLSGAFLGAARKSFPIGGRERANILEDAGRRSDRDTTGREHGTPGNAELWTKHGMDRRDPAACNTWQAGEELVE